MTVKTYTPETVNVTSMQLKSLSLGFWIGPFRGKTANSKVGIA